MKLIVVPVFVPRTVVFPKFELLMTTSACPAPARSASITPLMVAVIESPTCTVHFERLCGGPVCASPPVGRSRLPGAIPSAPVMLSPGAAGAKIKTVSTSEAPTAHIAAQVRSIPPIAAVPLSP